MEGCLIALCVLDGCRRGGAIHGQKCPYHLRTQSPGAAAGAEPRSPTWASTPPWPKLFCSDTAMWVTTEAVQVLGGYGYIKEYPVERMMRDAKITQIYEGSNEIQRIVIAREMVREGRSSLLAGIGA